MINYICYRVHVGVGGSRMACQFDLCVLEILISVCGSKLFLCLVILQ